MSSTTKGVLTFLGGILVGGGIGWLVAAAANSGRQAERAAKYPVEDNEIRRAWLAQDSDADKHAAMFAATEIPWAEATVRDLKPSEARDLIRHAKDYGRKLGFTQNQVTRTIARIRERQMPTQRQQIAENRGTVSSGLSSPAEVTAFIADVNRMMADPTIRKHTF